MKKINEITKGKAKSMFSTENEDHIIMHFSDDTSAFDGKKREALLGKGAVNNQFNAFIMNHLKDNGVESHLIEVIDSTDSLVYKLDMFPIECVIRNRASGSICKRLGTEDGLVLENPLFEFFLKDDDLGDPLINGLILVDFKVEYVLFKDKILLADEFTPDGCRLWDSETLKKMDKDRFRQGLGDVVESYHQVADRLGMNIET